MISANNVFIIRVEHVYGFFKQYCPNLTRTLSLSEEEVENEDEPLEDEEEEVCTCSQKSVHSSWCLNMDMCIPAGA
jgi:hypothetical protein